MDWHLTILTNPSEPGRHLWGLRKSVHLSNKEIYYAAVVVDLLLRYSTFQLS